MKEREIIAFVAISTLVLIAVWMKNCVIQIRESDKVIKREWNIMTALLTIAICVVIALVIYINSPILR